MIIGEIKDIGTVDTLYDAYVWPCYFWIKKKIMTK